MGHTAGKWHPQASSPVSNLLNNHKLIILIDHLIIVYILCWTQMYRKFGLDLSRNFQKIKSRTIIFLKCYLNDKTVVSERWHECYNRLFSDFFGLCYQLVLCEGSFWTMDKHRSSQSKPTIIKKACAPNVRQGKPLITANSTGLWLLT